VGSGFQTTLRDLSNAAGSFHDGADQFGQVLHDITALKVDSGDSGLDSAVSTTMAALDALHTQVVKALRETGDNLAKVRDDYQRSDVSARELYDDILKAEPITEK
jgi:ABC-type transporter Mla subunit MlaD